jgi:hypothetical protein
MRMVLPACASAPDVTVASHAAVQADRMRRRRVNRAIGVFPGSDLRWSRSAAAAVRAAIMHSTAFGFATRRLTRAIAAGH